MRASVIQIGNSRGIRIPKSILEQCHLANHVELEPQKNALVIRSLSSPRRGWAEAFHQMSRMQDDLLLDPSSSSPWDQSEWKW